MWIPVYMRNKSAQEKSNSCFQYFIITIGYIVYFYVKNISIELNCLNLISKSVNHTHVLLCDCSMVILVSAIYLIESRVKAVIRDIGHIL